MKQFIKSPLFYGKKTLMVTLEFGVLLSEVAKKENIELTKEMVARAEDILLSELRDNGYKKTALNFIPLLLAALAVKEL